MGELTPFRRRAPGDCTAFWRAARCLGLEKVRGALSGAAGLQVGGRIGSREEDANGIASQSLRPSLALGLRPTAGVTLLVIATDAALEGQAKVGGRLVAQSVRCADGQRRVATGRDEALGRGWALAGAPRAETLNALRWIPVRYIAGELPRCPLVVATEAGGGPVFNRS